ncbi:MAG TPA: helicase-associated domain-containing protein [bacterium]|nr:helicase-associated domain-containing protein [bacterium]
MLHRLPEPLSLPSGLAALALENLAAVAERVGLQEELTSKARLLASIPERLADRNVVRRFVRELEPAAAKTLAVAAACEKLSPVLGASVLARFGAASPPGDLVTRALLLPDPSTGLHRPPLELLPYVHAEFARAFGGAEAEAPASPATLEPASAFRDAVTIWCYVIKNPIILTQSGATPKRALAKLVPLLEVAEEDDPVKTVVESFGFSRLELLAEDVERRGALTRNNGELYAAEWLGAGVGDVARSYNVELVRAVMEEDETGGALLAAYACSLSPARRWRPLAEIGDAVKKVATESDGTSVRKAALSLFATGALSAGVDAGGALLVAPVANFEKAYRLEPPAAAPELLLGGNFELKANYDAPVETRLKIEAFADQTGGGRFLSYRISKESFYRALDAGITADDVLSFLKEHVSRPVPQNVEFSLRDWAGQYGAIRFYDGLVVAAQERDKADEIARLPAVAPHVRGRRELHAVEIARKDYRAVREALTAAGYLPQSLAAEPEYTVSPRTLFDAGAAPAPARAGRENARAAVIEFAVDNDRPLKLWLEGEEAPVDVKPVKIVVSGGEAYLHVAGDAARTRIPLAAIERLEYA